MEILNSSFSDMPAIFEIYHSAAAYQKRLFHLYWLSFSPATLEKEISEKRHWKMVVGNNIGCVFSITYADQDIWFEMDNNASIYIHRIAVNPAERGAGFVPRIIDWAKQHAAQTGKTFIRIDTLSGNKKLADYYLKCGFKFVASLRPRITDASPPHYVGAVLDLFEIEL